MYYHGVWFLYCWIFFFVMGAVYGIWYWISRNREKWQQLKADLLAQFAESLKRLAPSLKDGFMLPSTEELANWRRLRENNLERARALESDAAAKETALALKHVEAEKVRHALAEASRDLSDLEARLAAAEARLAEARKRATELRPVADEKDSVIMDLERKLSGLEKRLAEREQAIPRITAQLRDKKDAGERNLRLIAEARQAKTDRDSDLEKVLRRQEELRRVLGDTRSKLETTERDRTNADKGVKTAEGQLRDLQEKLRGLDREELALQQEKATDSTRLEQLRQELADLIRIMALQGEVKTAIENLRSRLAGVEKEKASHEQPLEQLQGDIRRLNDRARNLEKEQGDLEKAKGSETTRIEALRQEIEELAQLRGLQEDARKALADARKRHDGVEKEAGAQDKALADVHGDHRATREKIRGLEKQEADMHRVRASEQAKLDALRAELAELERVRRLQEDLKKAVADLQAHLSKADKDRGDLNSALEQLQGEVQTARERLNALGKQEADLERTRSVDGVRADNLGTANRDRRAGIDRTVERTRELPGRIDTAERTMATRLAEAENHLAGLREELRRAETVNRDIEGEEQKLVAEIERLKRQRDDARGSLGKEQSKLQEQRSNLVKINQKIQDHTKHVDELNRRLATLHDQERDLDQRISIIEPGLNERGNSLQEMERRLTTLRQELSVTEKELADMRAMAHNLDLEIQQLIMHMRAVKDSL